MSYRTMGKCKSKQYPVHLIIHCHLENMPFQLKKKKKSPSGVFFLTFLDSGKTFQTSNESCLENPQTS